MLVLEEVLAEGTDISTESGKVSNTTLLQSEAPCFLEVSILVMVVSADLRQVKTEEKRPPSLSFYHGK